MDIALILVWDVRVGLTTANSATGGAGAAPAGGWKEVCRGCRDHGACSLQCLVGRCGQFILASDKSMWSSGLLLAVMVARETLPVTLISLPFLIVETFGFWLGSR
jgi:hypothetical protein